MTTPAQTTTTTVTQDSTTSLPVPDFVTKGLMSPTHVINLCAADGRWKQTIECPTDYVISITNAFYGTSIPNNCFYT